MMYDPPHPGEIVREDCINASGLTITEAADRLDVSRQALSAVLNGHARITPDMAVRLEDRMKWSRAEVWVHLQADYDLWQARHRGPMRA